ncbi:MAG: hypothetical protein JSV08_02755 [Acidobacteriota bacterium]|nr:MAG: hypothetical protein JSV08_02755 [Acidobacteriota bacterium]
MPACSDTTVPGTTVTVDPLPTPVITETCGDPTSTLDAGGPYASYSWTSVPPGEPGDGATTQTIQVPCNSTGSYTVTVQDSVTLCFGTSPAEDVTNCTCGGVPPNEPSDPIVDPGAPQLKIVDAAGLLVDVQDETASGATAYVVYENAIGTFYGTPGQSACLTPIGPGAEPGTVQLDYLMGAPDVWIVVTSANADGESSAGRAMDPGPVYVERNLEPGWPASTVCP